MNKLAVILLLFVFGCKTDQHSAHVYFRDKDHVEVVLDRPMSFEFERDGVKVKANSLKPGLLEDIFKLLFLQPR